MFSLNEELTISFLMFVFLLIRHALSQTQTMDIILIFKMKSATGSPVYMHKIKVRKKRERIKSIQLIDTIFNTFEMAETSM